MDVVLGPFAWLVTSVIDIYVFILIVGVVLSWLIAFDVVNRSNRFVYMVGDFCYRLTEPALRPIRNLLPNLGGIDIAPVVLILGLYFLKGVLINLIVKFG